MGFRTSISVVFCGVPSTLSYGTDYTIDGNTLEITLLNSYSLYD